MTASPNRVGLTRPVEIQVVLLTGGFDKPYVLGLAKALVSREVYLDIIGSDGVDSPELHDTPKLNFLNLQGAQSRRGTANKLMSVLIYYARLIHYVSIAKPKLFHILWNNKLQLLDRTFLMLYYKLRGKKIVFTAHNVNAGIRDSNDSWHNRLTLRIQYRLADRIFVHTKKMKRELVATFGVSEGAVSVIPFGINNAVPVTDLTPNEAKQRLGIGSDEKTILFFGNIGPYKGLEYLVAAFQLLASTNTGYRLIIAGKVRGGSEKYFQEIQRTIAGDVSREWVRQRIEYIPDEDTELYFKGADLLVLPYTHISQSGVLFLGFSFGLPVVATDVGSLGDDIVEGRTGFLCKPCDPAQLAHTIETYFESDLFRKLDNWRQEIRAYTSATHSWDAVAEATCAVYAELLMREIS